MQFRENCSTKQALTEEDKIIPEIRGLDLPEIDGHNDKLNLHYLFFDPKKIYKATYNHLEFDEFQSIILTSLLDKQGHLCNW